MSQIVGLGRQPLRIAIREPRKGETKVRKRRESSKSGVRMLRTSCGSFPGNLRRKEGEERRGNGAVGVIFGRGPMGLCEGVCVS